MNVSNSSGNNAYTAAAAIAAFSPNDKAVASATLARAYELDLAEKSTPGKEHPDGPILRPSRDSFDTSPLRTEILRRRDGGCFGTPPEREFLNRWRDDRNHLKQ
jgi:hypothetical protein